jgi:hypothetical protein
MQRYLCAPMMPNMKLIYKIKCPIKCNDFDKYGWHTNIFGKELCDLVVETSHFTLEIPSLNLLTISMFLISDFHLEELGCVPRKMQHPRVNVCVP